jgi:hypothetical protein
MEVDDVTERVRAFSLRPLDDLAAMLADVEAKIPEMNDQMKAAAAAGDYEIAADLKARSKRLAGKADIIKRAQVAAIAAKKKRAFDERSERGDISLPSAADVAAKANAVWDARIAEVLEPLKSALDTVLGIVKQGVELAAAGGSTSLSVRTGVVPVGSIRALLLLTSEKVLRLFNSYHPHVNGPIAGYPLDECVEELMEKARTLTLAKVTGMEEFAELSPVDLHIALDLAIKWKDAFEKPLRKRWKEEEQIRRRHGIVSEYDEREGNCNLNRSEMKHLREHLHFYIAEDNAAEEEAPPELPPRVDYVLDLCYCYVPVGKDLTRDDMVTFYGLCHATKTLKYDSFEPGPYPLMPLFLAGCCDIERGRFLEIASSFDDEFIHSFEDVKAVWESYFARLHAVWQMRNAGYKVIVYAEGVGDNKEEEQNEDEQLTLESVLFTVDFLGAADPAGEKSFRRYAQDELDGIGAVRLLT